MRAVVSLTILLVASAALAAPAPLPKPSKAAAGPFEIDFKPLDGVAGPTGWGLHIQISDDKGKDSTVFTLTGGEKFDVKLEVWSLTHLPIKSLECTADKSGDKLIIKSFHGKPPSSVKVWLTGLDKSFTPKVKRLSK